MSFDWMEVPKRPSFKEARRAQHGLALTEQAALLHRLGYTKKFARARLEANLKWEFECIGRPPITQRDINQIVKRIFG